MKRVVLILFSLLLFYATCFSQNKELVDSLLEELKNPKKDSITIYRYADLAFELRFSDHAKAIEYCNQAIVLAKKLNHIRGEAKAHNVLGLSYTSSGQYENAIEEHTQAKKLYDSIKDKLGLAKTYHNTAYAYQMMGNNALAKENYLLSASMSEKLQHYDLISINYMKVGDLFSLEGNYVEALKYHQKVLSLSVEVQDSIGQSDALNSIGLLHISQKNFDLALDYFNQSLSIGEKIKDPISVSKAYNNIGIVYNKKKEYKTALDYYLKSLKIKEELSDAHSLVTAYSNVSIVYKELKDFDNAILYVKKSLAIDEMNNDFYGISINNMIMAEIEVERKDFTSAETYLKKSLDVALKSGFKEIQYHAYLGLATIYSSTNKYKEAYENFQKYSLLKDSLLNKETSEQMSEMQVKFETEKKQKEIELLKKDNLLQDAVVKKQKTLSYSIAGGLLLVVVFSIFIWNRLRITNRQKAIIEHQKQMVDTAFKGLEEKKKEIEVKNSDLELAYHHIEEKNNEILSSIRYAKRIQEAILPPDSVVKKHLPDSFILYMPKDIVAGDFYWMELASVAEPVEAPEVNLMRSPSGAEVPASPQVKQGVSSTSDISAPLDDRSNAPNQLILFAAADCTGHGVPGALVSVVCSNALNRAVKEFGITDTGKILDKVTDLVLESFSKSETEMKDGMDISLCRLQYFEGSDTVSLQFSGANNSIYIVRSVTSSEVEKREEKDFSTSLEMTTRGDSHISNLNTHIYLEEVKADKQPIGNFPDRKPFTTHTLELKKSDVIYAFSDGYADQFGGPKSKKFKYSQFEKLLLDNHQQDMEKQKELLHQATMEWRGQLEQIDDICVFGVRL